ncbi:MAG TPA: DUF3892 domain-containing protein [Mucilaginibacter sp.]|jgi:hypothetical protein|nr:DUF3892 domain-containing protein [Mucilaginibacter sp.]
MSVRITCIKKNSGNHENPYLAIETLTWINESTNAVGTSSREQIYDWVKDGGYGYVKDSAGNTARLLAEISPKGTKFVKTKPDDEQTDNLLKLPECK